MKTRYSLATSISAMLIAAHAWAVGSQEPTLAMVDASESVIQILTAADLWVGGAVGVYANDVESQKTYGDTDPGVTTAPSANAIYEIASLSKSFTGVLLALALEENKGLKVDDAIGKYLPEVANNSYVAAITLRQLATHTSGLPDAGDLFSSANFNINNPYVNYDKFMLLNYLKSAQPGTNLADPGNLGTYRRSYSNVGFATLGLVLTRVYKMDFASLIKMKITRSLNMNHTFVNGKKTVLPRLTMKPYGVAKNLVEHWQWDAFAPAGGIVSTLPDMMKYLRANIRCSPNLLGRAMSLSHQLGLGWDSNPSDGIVWKNGQSAGFASLFAFDRVHETGIFVLSNMGSMTSDRVAAEPMETAGQFPASSIYSFFPNHISNKIIPSPAILATAPGTYRDLSGQGPDIILKSSDNSLVIFDGQNYQVALAGSGSPNHLAIYDGVTANDSLDLDTTATGEVKGFTAQVGGKSRAYLRVSSFAK